jgi:GWxTD domain-containing protein
MTRIGAALCASLLLLPFAESYQGEVPERHRIWLEQEAEPIITPEERDVFLGLATDAARDRFASDFWAVRDPTPGTPRNEYREEHLRRVGEARRLYSVGSRPPWRTDRGRIFILLGPPNQVDRLPESRNFYPLEIWYYDRAAAAGIHDPVTLLFFKRSGFGDYVLYSPSLDGVNSLLTPTQSHRFIVGPNDVATRQALLDGLQLSSAELPVVDAAIYVAPRVSGAGAEALLARVQRPPALDVSYLDRYRLGLVESEATFRTLALDAGVTVFSDLEALGEVDLAIQLPPDALPFEQEGDEYRLELEVTGEIRDRGASRVETFDGKIEVRFDEREIRDFRFLPLLYQQRLWLLPGDYDLALTVRTPATGALGHETLSIRVPHPGEGLSFGGLLLMHGAPSAAGAERERPFVRGERLVVPAVPATFRRGSTPHLYYEVHRPPSSRGLSLGATYFILREGTTVLRWEEILPPSDERVVEVEAPLSIGAIEPGTYTLLVQVADEKGGSTVVSERSFEVVEDYVVRGRIDAVVREEPSLAERDLFRGEYWLKRGELERARALLEKAYRADPRSTRARVLIGRVLALQGELEVARDLLEAALREEGENAEALLALAYVRFHLGQPDGAIETYRRLLSFQPSEQAWNGLAEVLLAQGRNGEALECLERSLALNPRQPDVERTLRELRREAR